MSLFQILQESCSRLQLTGCYPEITRVLCALIPQDQSELHQALFVAKEASQCGQSEAPWQPHCASRDVSASPRSLPMVAAGSCGVPAHPHRLPQLSPGLQSSLRPLAPAKSFHPSATTEQQLNLVPSYCAWNVLTQVAVNFL